MEELKKIIEKLANDEYPVNTKKDIDGDWYDTNESNREAFMYGCFKLLEVMNKGLNSKE